MITGYNWIAWSTCTQVDSFEKFLNDYGRNYNDSYRYIKRTKAHLVEQTEPDQHGQTGETTLCGREIPHVMTGRGGVRRKNQLVTNANSVSAWPKGED